MNSKPLTIRQLKEARKLRRAFLKTTDGVEAVPTPQDFVSGVVEMDERVRQIHSEVEADPKNEKRS